MDRTHERVRFTVYSCPFEDCRFIMCWVNPRRPNYCPECGRSILATIRERVMMTDDEAILTLHGTQPMAGGVYLDPDDPRVQGIP